MSSHKDRMEAPRVPDLSQPSVPALVHLLRNPDNWPAGFEWNFSKSECCAIGLVDKVWGKNYKDVPDINEANEATQAFYHSGPTMNHLDVKPDHVADRLTEYLERTSR